MAKDARRDRRGLVPVPDEEVCPRDVLRSDCSEKLLAMGLLLVPPLLFLGFLDFPASSSNPAADALEENPNSKSPAGDFLNGLLGPELANGSKLSPTRNPSSSMTVVAAFLLRVALFSKPLNPAFQSSSALAEAKSEKFSASLGLTFFLIFLSPESDETDDPTALEVGILPLILALLDVLTFGFSGAVGVGGSCCSLAMVS